MGNAPSSPAMSAEQAAGLRAECDECFTKYMTCVDRRTNASSGPIKGLQGVDCEAEALLYRTCVKKLKGLPPPSK